MSCRPNKMEILKSLSARSTLWEELCAARKEMLVEVEEYRRNNDEFANCPPNPVCLYMDTEIFFILNDILKYTLQRAVDTGSVKFQKSPFNAIDQIAECLWNFNPRYPSRRIDNLQLHDMPWVVEHLQNSPRPYFPFSYVWSRDFAAMKIQAYVRGYWVRRRDDVQEMRQFWKTYVVEKELAVSERFSIMGSAHRFSM